MENTVVRQYQLLLTSGTLIKPQRMCDLEGYNSRMGVHVCVCVCLSVCLFDTIVVATYLVYMSKVRRHTVSCRLEKLSMVWTSLKMFSSGDMALFASHDDRQLSSFLDKNTPMVLDTTRNGIVYEPLARSDDYLT